MRACCWNLDGNRHPSPPRWLKLLTAEAAQHMLSPVVYAPVITDHANSIIPTKTKQHFLVNSTQNFGVLIAGSGSLLLFALRNRDFAPGFPCFLRHILRHGTRAHRYVL